MATCDFSFLCSIVVIRDVPGVSNRVSIVFSLDFLRPLVLRVVPFDPPPGAGFWIVRLCSSVRVAFHAPRKQLSDQIGLTVIIGGPTTTTVSHAPASLVGSRSVPSPGSPEVLPPAPRLARRRRRRWCGRGGVPAPTPLTRWRGAPSPQPRVGLSRT